MITIEEGFGIIQKLLVVRMSHEPTDLACANEVRFWRPYSIQEQKGGAMNVKRWLITLMIALVFGAAFGCVVWFGFVLNGAPNTRNLEKWNEFGGFIGGLIGPLLSFVNLLLIVYIAVSLNPSERKTQLTLTCTGSSIPSRCGRREPTGGSSFCKIRPRRWISWINRIIPERGIFGW
jgi:hypothetical protein